MHTSLNPTSSTPFTTFTSGPNFRMEPSAFVHRCTVDAKNLFAFRRQREFKYSYFKWPCKSLKLAGKSPGLRLKTETQDAVIKNTTTNFHSLTILFPSRKYLLAEQFCWCYFSCHFSHGLLEWMILLTAVLCEGVTIEKVISSNERFLFFYFWILNFLFFNYCLLYTSPSPRD